MHAILFISMVIILSAALPWWPYSAHGRLRHHRPWDWLLDDPSGEDFSSTASEKHQPDQGLHPKHAKRFDEADPGNSGIRLMLHDPTPRLFKDRWAAAASSHST
jgi:hypothetical protein